jgi:hypothetical protein
LLPLAALAATLPAAGRPPLTPEQEMLWTYAARCALAPGQALQAPVGSVAHEVTFAGALGLAPQWRDGTCDAACQEKVSACVAALMNPTGKHVHLSLLSEAPSMPETLRVRETDAGFPLQEGAFFGNVFQGTVYACRGRQADQGAQVQRFCAAAPDRCRGIVDLRPAGACDQACRMICRPLTDGSQRCAAAACTDPSGRVWKYPITIYLRDRIEAGNADTITGAVSRAEGLADLQDGGQALYRQVDFGAAGSRRRFVATVVAPKAGGALELWTGGGRVRLALLPIAGTGGRPRELRAPLNAAGLAGQQDLLLKFRHPPPGLRVVDLALR